MNIQIDNTAKTVALLENCKVADVFNLLMKWFPEDWEEWTFTKTVVNTTPIVIEKNIWRNPYWTPYTPYYYNTAGVDSTDRIENPYQINSLATLTLNQ